MRVSNGQSTLTVTGGAYSLTFPADRPFVYVDDSSGARLMELFILSSVHALHDLDDTVSVDSWQVDETVDEVVCTLHARSSVWMEKRYRVRCLPDRFVYEVEIAGAGRLAETSYFGGYASSHPRWGSGLFWSGQHFKRSFTPEPNSEEQHYFPPHVGLKIDLGGVPLPAKGDWFFTPPPFCFGFEGAHGWIGIGVQAAPGANRWTEYRYQTQSSGFCLSLSYDGHTEVAGSYRLPAVCFDFGADEFAALEAHVAGLEATRATPAPRREHAAWWFEPIFCGWGSQCYEAAIGSDYAPEYSRQQLYESWLHTLSSNGVRPGVIVLDDKWQATYGDNRADAEKWPDLPGFVAAQHAAGRKVLLWLRAWSAEGVPAHECITNAAGTPVAVDPSNPAYEQRLRDSVRRMLARDGYDADGFKIDFTARIPSGPGMRTQGDVWGLELMRLYLEIVYDEAKKTKPDALIMTHTPHPYLADVLDMIRLNDALDLGRLDDPATGRNITATMTTRARVAAIACPHAIIDTDNWPVRDRAAWREYLNVQTELGVPSLYFASHIDLTREPLEPDDYQLIARLWADYRARRQGT